MNQENDFLESNRKKKFLFLNEIYAHTYFMLFIYICLSLSCKTVFYQLCPRRNLIGLRFVDFYIRLFSSTSLRFPLSMLFFKARNPKEKKTQRMLLTFF